MNFAEFLGSVVAALLFTSLFWFVLRIRGPWGSIGLFFLIVLFGVLTVAVWIEPIGPVYRDVAWGPLLVGGIIFSLILAAATPKAKPREEAPRSKSQRRQEHGMRALNVFFWILLVFFGVAIVIGLTGL